MNDAQYLKTVRDQLNLTQSEMADKLGYRNRENISDIERGASNMSPQTRAHLRTIQKYQLEVIHPNRY